MCRGQDGREIKKAGKGYPAGGGDRVTFTQRNSDLSKNMLVLKG